MSVEGFLNHDGDGDGNRPRRAAAHRQRLRDSKVFIAVMAILALVLIAAVAIVGYYGKATIDGLNSIQRDPSLAPTEGASRPAPVPTKEGTSNPPINIVLMGSDTRGGERGRSDVLQLLHVPGDRSGSYLMSIPRDTWVQIPGRGNAKVNAAYAYGGAGLTIETLELLLDVPMDHTVIIDFEGFTRVIDALGGVTVQNQHATSSGGYTFPKGQVELTGESALVFVRERYNLPAGDFDRAERQRAVVMAVVDKLASAGTLADPGKFRDAITTLGPNFTVDAGLTNQAIIDLGLGMGTNATNIKSFQFPVAGTDTSSDGQSIVVVDSDRIVKLKEALRNDDMATYYEQYR